MKFRKGKKVRALKSLYSLEAGGYVIFARRGDVATIVMPVRSSSKILTVNFGQTRDYVVGKEEVEPE